MIPFYPSRSDNQVVTPSAVSASVAINKDTDSIRFVNSGAKICYVKFGSGAQVATVADIPVLPGESVIVGKGYEDNTCAFISAEGTTLNIQTGSGGVFDFIAPANSVGTIDLVNLTALLADTPYSNVAPDYFLALYNNIIKRISNAFYDPAMSIAAAGIGLGDLLVGSGPNTFKRLDVGAANKLLGVNAGGTDLEYKTVPGAAVADTATTLAGTNVTDPLVAGNLKAASLLADFYLTHRTKMPDGATPGYSQDAWATDDSWIAFNSATISVAGGELLFTQGSVTGGFRRVMTIAAGKDFLMRIKRTAGTSGRLKIENSSAILFDSGAGVDLYKTGEYVVVKVKLNALVAGTTVYVTPMVNGANTDTCSIDWIWIGDYSYLTGSLSEEAARVWSEAADAPGVPQAAVGTIGLGTGDYVDGETVTIGGKVYTARNAISATRVEGEFLIAGTLVASDLNLKRAIIRESPETYDYNGTTPRYNCAEAHSLVTATNPSGVALTARNAGEQGNNITMATSAPTKAVLSGSTLAGGVSAGAAKMSYLVARGSQNLDAKTALVAGDYLTLLDSVVGFLKKKILVSQFFAADGGTGAFTAVQGNDARLQTAPATWTPVPRFGGVNDDGTFTISQNYFTKAGKHYHLEAVITWTAQGTKTGAFELIGLPTAHRASVAMPVGIMMVLIGGASLPAVVILRTTGSNMYAVSQGAAAIADITHANFTNTTSIRIVADFIGA